jgi:tetratricopeptide (TPR) repeat protein
MKPSSFLLLLFCSVYSLTQQISSNTAEIAIPNVKGALDLDVGTANFETRARPDGKEVQLRAFARPDGLEISAFLQRVTFASSAEKCRDEWWPGTKKSSPFQLQDIQDALVKNGIARTEYMIADYQGIKVHQKNVHAYLGSGDLCAEVHMSKAGFKPEDEKLFEQVLSSIKLLPDQLPSDSQLASTTRAEANDAARYFAEGSKYYLKQDYTAAASYYQKGLDLEKQQQTLSQNNFRVLVDNLGMSYGMTGKLAEAKATFEYGLTRDPEYPLFYYNVACAYGEMNKMEEALAQLRLANKYKANMIPGETFPDPLQDDSFKFFVKNPTFVSAVREMQK